MKNEDLLTLLSTFSNKTELLTNLLPTLPINTELLVDVGDRYAEIKDVKIEYSQRDGKRKPYVVISIYR